MDFFFFTSRSFQVLCTRTHPRRCIIEREVVDRIEPKLATLGRVEDRRCTVIRHGAPTESGMSSDATTSARISSRRQQHTQTFHRLHPSSLTTLGMACSRECPPLQASTQLWLQRQAIIYDWASNRNSSAAFVSKPWSQLMSLSTRQPRLHALLHVLEALSARLHERAGTRCMASMSAKEGLLDYGHV